MKISKVVCGVLAGLALSSASFALDNDLNDVPDIQAVNLNDDIAQAEREKQAAEEIKNEKNRHLEDLREQKNTEEGKKQAAERSKQDKQDEISNLNQNIETQKAEILRRTKEKEQSEGVITTGEPRLEQLKNELEALNSEIEKLKNDKNSAKEALERVNIASINGDSTKEVLIQKKDQINGIGIASNAVEDDTAQKDAAIDKLKQLQQAGITIDGVDDLKKSSETSPSDKATIDTALSKAKERIDALIADLTTIIEKIEAAGEGVEAISGFDTKLTEKNEEKGRKEDDKNTTQGDVDREKKRKAELEKQIEQAEVEKNKLETQLTQAQQELENIKRQSEQIIQNANQKIQELSGQIENLNQEIQNQQKEIDRINKKLEDAKKQIEKAKKLLSENELDSEQKDVLSSLLEVRGNDLVNIVISQGTTEQISEFVKSNATSINQALQSLNAGFQTEIVKFSSDLSTNTRLAKLSNPFNSDLALAYAVKNLSGEMFADNGDSMSSVVKYYTDRFNYDNNLWGNIIGAKGKVKDGGNPELYGFTLGYDKAFDDTIFGAFITYAKSKVNYDRVKNEADNYQIGVYTRTYMDNHEIDAKFSVGVAKNELDRSVKVGANTLNQTGKYNSTFTSFNLDYGYVISINDATFVKPIVGLSHSFVKNKEFREKGDLPLHYKANRSRILNVKLASEFRKYVSDGSYLYVAPGLERELYKRVDDSVVRFIGSNKDIIFTNNGKKSTYFTVQTGADFKLTENLSTNINFGAKVKSKNQFYNGNIGLRYKF